MVKHRRREPSSEQFRSGPNALKLQNNVLDARCQVRDESSMYYQPPDGRPPMRTTLDIDADVLAVAKEVAILERRTVGRIVSDLMREALRARASLSAAAAPRRDLYGFRPIPSGGAAVTNALVDKLREELEL